MKNKKVLAITTALAISVFSIGAANAATTTNDSTEVPKTVQQMQQQMNVEDMEM